MAWIAGAVAIGGALLQSQAADKAADQAASAANRGTDSQLQIFKEQNQQQAPYRQAGYNALNALQFGTGIGGHAPGTAASAGSALSSGMPLVTSSGGVPTQNEQLYASDPLYKAAWDNILQGHVQNLGGGYGTTSDAGWIERNVRDYMTRPDAYGYTGPKPGEAGTQAQTGGTSPGGIDSGYFSHQFNAGDLNANLAPNYAFQLAQGQGAARNAGNLQTGLISGNTMKGLEDYTQNYAGGAYQQAFNNYTANQSNIFNRLSNIAGLGQAANTQSAGLAGQMSGNIAGTMQSAGAAQAAGTVGQANALSGGAGNALGWYQASKFMQPQTGGGGLNQFSIDNP